MTDPKRLGQAFLLGFAFSKGLKSKFGTAYDAEKWITVHPNGKGITKSGDKAKGQPVLIDDATGEVLGGMGGKFTGKHISAVPKRGIEEQAGAQAKIDWTRAKRANSQKEKNKPLSPEVKEKLDRELANFKMTVELKRRRTNNLLNLWLNTDDPFSDPYSESSKNAIANTLPYLQFNKDQIDELIKEFGEMAGNGYVQEFKKQRDSIEECIDKVKNALQKFKTIAENRKKQIAKDGISPKTLAGSVRGKPITPKEAIGISINKPNTNPDFLTSVLYQNNCQTCVVALEARIRGYDLKASKFGEINNKLSENTKLAWIEPETGEFAKYTELGKGTNSRNLIKRIKANTENGARYTIEWGWGRSRSGHIISLFKENDQLMLIDPQSGKEYDESGFLSMLVDYRAAMGSFKLIRVDDKAFYSYMCDKVLIKG